MPDGNYDYSDHVEKPDATSVIGRIDAAIAELRVQRGQLALLELQMKKAQERVRDLEEVVIPELMESLGWTEGSKLVTLAGNEVTLKRVIHASPVAATKDQMWQWLDDHGHGGMIKRKVVIPFGRDDETEVGALMSELSGRYDDVAQEKKVEPTTFSAWVRQRIEAGEEYPADLINVNTVKLAKVK